MSELSAIQFGKTFDPIRRKVDDESEGRKRDMEPDATRQESDQDKSMWEDDEDRAANFIVTNHPIYKYKKLPNIIKIKNPTEGEVAIFVKRTIPKAARFHKKREDNDPHRFFLSELMLYTGYTDEEQLGANDEEKCRKLYLEKKDDIQLVKSYMMPYLEGIEEARYYV